MVEGNERVVLNLSISDAERMQKILTLDSIINSEHYDFARKVFDRIEKTLKKHPREVCE